MYDWICDFTPSQGTCSDFPLLLVSQFTLVADTRSGLRPSFSTAAPPVLGEQLFDYLLDTAKQKYAIVASGSFGNNMQVQLINDGPVTFLLTT